jgi:hypothetical protein
MIFLEKETCWILVLKLDFLWYPDLALKKIPNGMRPICQQDL